MSDEVEHVTSENTSLAPRQPQHIHRPRAARPSASGRSQSSSHMVKPTPAFFWWAFRQWWMVVVPVGLILAGAAAAFVVATYEPDYEAAALIMIEDSAPFIAFNDAGTSSHSYSYVQTQIELMRSPLVLQPVLSDPTIATQPEIANSGDRLATLRRHLSIVRIGQSELYNVTYKCKSPHDSADAANAVVHQYMKIQYENDQNRTSRVVELLDQERLRRQAEVDRLRRELMKLGEGLTGENPFTNKPLDFVRANNPVSNTYQQLTQIDLDLVVANAQLQSFKEAPAPDATNIDMSAMIDLHISRSKEVQERKEFIEQLMSKISDFKLKSKDWENDPGYVRYENQLKREREGLEELKAELREAYMADIAGQREAEGELKIAGLEREIDILQKKREELSKKFESEKGLAKSGGSRTVEFEFKKAELKREEKIFEMIASRSLAIQTESRAPARVTLKQEASPPLHPVSRIPYKILILACSCALLAPFGLAVLREMSICRITDVEHLSREGSRPVIGEVSHFPIRRVAANPQLLPAKLRRQMFLYLESIDSLRTNIALSEHGKDKQLIVVTSAAAGEGKTCLSTSLAMSIARADKKPTLIIDGDLRSPDVASVLAVRERPGLAELLTNEASLADVIQRVGKTNAFVIPAGRFKGNPHHIINEARLKPVLDRLRSQFSTIVLDTPPIFGGSESLVFARAADAVVVSVLADVSRSRQLNGAIDRLDRAGANVIGVVLNGTSTQSYAYSYGYGYYSGRLESLDG